MATTYKIGEAAVLLNLKTYVLRFWETEFPEIAPLRTEKGQRLYTEEHLALLERIRYLLHDRGLTIGGARKALAEEKARGVTYVYGPASALRREAPQDGPPPVFSEFSGLGDEGGNDASDEEQEDERLDSGGGTLHEGQERRAAPLLQVQDSPALVPFLPSARQADQRQRSQYNLPGLERIVALRDVFAPERAGTPEGEERAAPENTGPEPAAQGMLPLFAVVRSAFLAGQAAGAAASGRGGDNFIQPGADAAVAGAIPAKASPNAVRASREAIHLLVRELEEVASILRADTSAKPAAGGQLPEPS